MNSIYPEGSVNVFIQIILNVMVVVVNCIGCKATQKFLKKQIAEMFNSGPKLSEVFHERENVENFIMVSDVVFDGVWFVSLWCPGCCVPSRGAVQSKGSGRVFCAGGCSSQP